VSGSAHAARRALRFARVTVGLAAVVLALSLNGCSGKEATRSAGTGSESPAPEAAGPEEPAQALLGRECDYCRMPIQDVRFVCERNIGTEWRIYDSIECLIGESGPTSALGAWLADHDTGTLHRADSMWVVHGRLTSPMGGGWAAFLSRPSADSVASASAGTVGRLAAMAAAPAR
jgi:hypothetical protein